MTLPTWNRTLLLLPALALALVPSPPLLLLPLLPPGAPPLSRRCTLHGKRVASTACGTERANQIG